MLDILAVRRDQAGKKYGRLVVLDVVRKVMWGLKKICFQCQCSCGNLAYIERSNLLSGRSKSCGCLHKELLSKRAKVHGMRHSKTYSVWYNIKQRCRNKNNPFFECYGGRGIDVCDEWFNSFEVFLRDVGEIPEGKRIDRADNDLGYVKGNIQFSTIQENNQNTRKSKWWIIDRVWYPSASAAGIILGLSPSTVAERCKGRHRDGKFYKPRKGCYSEFKYPQY